MPRRLSKSSTDGSKFSGSARQTTLTTSYTGPKGDKGDKGDTGAAGADADTPNWTLQTSTVAAGGTPTVNATGTYPNQTITFGLVTGATGEQGDVGNTGPQGPQATAQTYVITVSGGKFYVDGTQQDTLHIFRNQKYVIDVSDSSTNSHPFYIQTTDNSGAYDSSNVYTSGVTNSGATTGSITFIPPSDAPSTLYYRCGSHSGMGGSISVKNLNPNDLQGTNGTDGTDGNGFTGGSYDSSTGVVTFTSDDALGFSTGDLRGADGADSTVAGPSGDGFTGGSYNSSTGVVTFASDDGLGFSTGDLRGTDGNGFTGGSYDSSTGIVTFTSGDGLGFTTGDLRGADGADSTVAGPAGQGVPTGGTSGQVLVKNSSTDYDTSWSASGSGTGGHAIKDEGGSALTTRANMTFIGELVEASDNSSTTSTDITMDAKTVWLYA